MAARQKLVLVVVDAMKAGMLERTIAAGEAPAMAEVMRRGQYVSECAAAFPSVTPVCAATIMTGLGPDAHHIPSMNWYLRGEGRYVEYGSSFSASRQFGVLRSLTDTVYRMNAEHLAPDALTVFESLDDADVRTAGTTYLIYRGRYRHEVTQDSALSRIAAQTLFRFSAMGPREFYYSDLFASRRTGCRGQLGLPGARDQHTGCVGTFLVENDLFDFLVFSLPDNDAHSHRNGPHAQVSSLAAADRQLERLMHAGGGPDRFLSEHAVIVCSDHSQAPVEASIRLDAAFADFAVATPTARVAGRGGEVALSPAQRSAMVYVLDPDERDEVMRRSLRAVKDVEGIDLAIWLDAASGEGVVRGRRGELRFAPGDDVADVRGVGWAIDGDLAVLRAEVQDGRFVSTEYPDALTRMWSALHCDAAGELLLSAAPGYEFVDWGGSDHVGGGSHGSLHRSDSLATLMWCGDGLPARDAREQWSLRDIAPMVRGHFGVAPPPLAAG